MAVEVQYTRHLFCPSAAMQPPSSFPDFDDIVLDDNTISKTRPSPPPVKWFYNPIHDLESLQWIALFFTISKDVKFVESEGNAPPATIQYDGNPVDPESEQARATRISNQYDYVRTLFFATTG